MNDRPLPPLIDQSTLKNSSFLMMQLIEDSCILSQQFQYYQYHKQKQEVQLAYLQPFPIIILLVNLSKMQANKMVNFHYSRQDPHDFNYMNTISSQHIVNSATILRFNYQNYQIPQQKREVKLHAYPSGRVETTTMPASFRPEESVTPSRKIKLVIAKKRKLSEKMKEIPYFISTQLKVNESRNESQSQSQHHKEEKVGINNAESFYLPLQRNHISIDYPKSCGLFSCCEEPLHNKAQYEQNFQIVREEESECHRIEMPEQEHFFPRKNTEYQKEKKLNHKQQPYRSTNRRRMFSSTIPSRKMFTITEQIIDSMDIPAPIAANWSKLQQASQWKQQSPTQNASPQFQNSPNNFPDIRVSS